MGASILTGQAVSLYRLCVLEKALKLECLGLKRSRGPSVYSSICYEFGLRGTKQQVYEQFQKLVAAEKAQASAETLNQLPK